MNVLKKITVATTFCLMLASCDMNKNIKKPAEVNLSVSTYATNVFLEESAQAYMSENPHVNIEIITYDPTLSEQITDGDNFYLVANDLVSFKKYIKSIDASLMAHTGTDIIAMDVLPFYKYIEDKYLVDINEFMDNDETFNRDDYFNNLFTNMEHNGKLYAVPLDYDAYIYSVLSTDLPLSGKVSEVIADGEQMVLSSNDGSMYMCEGAYPLFKILYEENYNKFLSFEEKKADFTSDEFRQILATVKELVDNNAVSDVSSLNPYTYYLNYDSIWSEDELMPYFGIMLGYGDEMLAKDYNNKGYYTVPHAVSISSSSQNKEESWKFIKYMLSEKMQNSASVYPINKNSLEEGFKANLLETLDKMEKKGIPLVKSSEEIAEEHTQKILTLSDELEQYHFKDPVIEQIIRTEVQRYFTNKQGEDETIQNIQLQVTEYLNE